ncbi:MAG: hypothetical protein NXI23_06455 [Bacteroidetes bacterium]|jgi:hypothetical protein|nr:hypothetical protein [Bacteroidota bacterium]MDF1867642.1 hypothetical protein [Saprospiraceae bacterium]
MKRKHLELNIVFFIAILLVGGIMGCKQDIDQFIPHNGSNPNAIGDIGRFFDKAQEDLSGTKYITSNDDNTIIRTQKGTHFHCTKGIFVNQNGELVAGDVELEILELFTKSEMVKYNRLPIASTKVALDSGGEIMIIARKNGEELKLAPNAKMLITTTNSDANSEMELFYGVNVDEPLAPNNQIFAWEEADQNPDTWDNVNAWEWQDSLTQNWSFGYVFETTQLGWINIDRFLKEPNLELTEVCMDLPNSYDPTNTVAFIVFEEINSVMPLWANADLEMFCQLNIPIDYKVKMVVISEQGDDTYYYAEESVTITKNMILEMTPKLEGFESVISAIENL